MLRRDDKISAWQTGILIFVLMFANKVLVLPSLVEGKAKWEVILIFGLLFSFESMLLAVFYFVKKRNPETSFFELLKNRFGNVFLISVCIFLFFYFFSKSVFLYSIIRVFLRSVMYRKCANILFVVCLLPVVNFVAYAGVRSFGRTLQIFFPILFFAILGCLIVGVLASKNDLIFYGLDFKSFALNAFKYSGAFGDMAFLFLIMDKIKIKKSQWKVVFSLSAVGMAFVVAVCVVFVFTYSSTAFLHPFAFFELLSFVKEYEGLGRLDIIPVLVIMFLTYFQMAVYFKAMLLTMENVFVKTDEKYFVGFVDVMFVLVVSVFLTNLSTTLWFVQHVLSVFSIAVFVLLPFISICLKRRE